jgi:hypothetical protein
LKFDNTGIDDVVVPFPVLENMMDVVGLIRGSHWDYDRATYDFKFEEAHNGNVYYLRVPAVAVKGEIEKRDCIVKLGTPYIGRYYYPHGVEYYDEEFPEHILTTCEDRLSKLNEALTAYKESALSEH